MGLGGIRFDPTEFDARYISGLALWLRADIGLIFNGSTIQTWQDQSGTGLNPTQATPTQQPSLTASDPKLGNQPSVSFLAGDSQALILATSAITLAQPNTIIVVGYGSTGFFVDGPTGSTGRNIVGISGSDYILYAGGGIISGPVADSNAHIFADVYNGASSAAYIDDSQTPSFAGNPGTESLIGLALGGTIGGFLTGSIAEVAMYTRALTSSERAKFYQTAGRRYGIATS